MGNRKRKKSGNKVILKLAILVVIIAIIVCIVKVSSQNNETEESTAKNEVAVEKDVTPPTITLSHEKDIMVVGEKYFPTAVATDELYGDLNDSIVVSDFDKNTPGEYEVTLTVEDKGGNKAEVKQKVVVRNELSNGLPVLMYHFFYDNIEYWPEDSNWLNVKDFEEQLKYLTENDFYFPTWEEVEKYIDGKIKLPEKSVVLTVDDGDASFFDVAVPVLQKYKVPATSFVISEWYGWRYDENMQYVIFESHSHSMHEAGANGKGRMVNWTKEQIVEDLNKSKLELRNPTVFCYPYGHYNDTAIEALKETGFRLAFTIEGGRVTVGANKYLLPRVRVTAGNSLNYFASSVK